ncbi:MAG: aldehyde ferredoxin oxidoreductase family protein [Deltaproteobacteria bacterium]|nr:aldehyde ferredoxin oxidoreductase family protein [Deltaproteobacteria bacterium]
MGETGMNGYMGTILTIDLTSGSIEKRPLDPGLARMFLGGNGFAAKFIHDLVPHTADPLSEENIVVFATGPFTGSPVWGTGRGHLASLSPQTGMFCDSNFGGDFASMLKRTGFDAVIISGRAATPVYISIHDGAALVMDAKDLWGKSTGDTHRMLVEREGTRAESAVIGPAGENGVVFAGIMCSGSRVSTAGRGGIGAVLGSKNCKGIVVAGTGKTVIADPDLLRSYLKTVQSDVRKKAAALSSMGTPFLVEVINARGMLGTHNNTRETFDRAGAISGEFIRENYQKKSVACRGCPVACGKLVSVPQGVFSDRDVKMPEYETLYAIGSMLDNDDIVSIFNGNTMCDEMGIDTISFGVTLAFLTECVERGIIGEAKLKTKISFGTWENLSEIVKKTALREEGIGRILSLGSEQLSELLGHDSYKFLYSQQGLEMAGHSARGLQGMGLAYATSTRGGSHHDARPNYVDSDAEGGFDERAQYGIDSEHNTALGDSLVICRFIQERAFGVRPTDAYIPALRAVTGWTIDLEELKALGERIYNLERIINVKRGANRSTAMLPYRVMNEPVPDGPCRGKYVPKAQLDKMLDSYYRLRGWDRNGVPLNGTLSRLGLA